MTAAAAVPGAARPGFMLPGQVLPGSSLPPGVTEALFTGSYELVYPSYIDSGALHTLVAEPGQEYEVEPPPGTGQPAVPDDGRWTVES